MRRPKKAARLCVTGLCGWGEFPSQKASNAENVSIWWRHHANFNILHSMYENIKTTVFCDGEKSKPFYCQLRVRQGECLSPFLFAMYINDLEMYLSTNNSGITVSHVKMFLLLYADDIVIFAGSAEELQSEINSLYPYCDRWKLKVNSSKSHVVVFKRGRFNQSERWMYGNEEITAVTKIPFLGLLFTFNGSFHQAQGPVSI